MPLYIFTHHPSTFTSAEKQTLAKSITSIYTHFGFPPFYVQVRFKEYNESELFVGGEYTTKFVGLEISHVARSFASERQKKGFLDQLDSILNPLFEPKGLQWEYFIAENQRDLWRINGIVPPPPGSELEKKWAKLNRPFKGASL